MIENLKLLRQNVLIPCLDKEALGNWLRLYLGVDLFDSIVSRYATSCPLDAAWETYAAAVYPTTRAPSMFLFASSRSTQKTLTIAAVDIAIIFHTRRNVLHYAAADTQLKPFKLYIEDYLNSPILKEFVDGDVTSSEAHFIIPNVNNELWLKGMPAKELAEKHPDQIRKVHMELLAITKFTTQGRHQSFMTKDETHTLEGDKLAAYKDLRKVPVASWDSKPWVDVEISSRKGPYTIVEKNIVSAKTTGLKVRTWTVMEGTEQCPTSRSGGDFIYERLVNPYDGKIYTKEEFEPLDEKIKNKCSATKLASGCLSCPLATVCLGDLAKPRRVHPKAVAIEAAILDILTYKDDRSLYIAQCLSLQPSKEGLVMPKYDEDVHLLTADQMYEKFKGEKPNQPQTLDSLVKMFRLAGLKCYCGLDWGYSHPFAVTVLFTDGERAFVVYSFANTGMEPEKDCVPFLKKLQNRIGKFTIFPDTARPDNNAILKRFDFDVQDEFVKDIDTGVARIQGFLSPMFGPSLIWFLKDHVDSLDGEMKMYHYKMNSDGTVSDEIEDDFNHNIDGLRYIFLNVFMEAISRGMLTEPKKNIHQEMADHANQITSNDLMMALGETFDFNAPFGIDDDET